MPLSMEWLSYLDRFSCSKNNGSVCMTCREVLQPETRRSKLIFLAKFKNNDGPCLNPFDFLSQIEIY